MRTIFLSTLLILFAAALWGQQPVPRNAPPPPPADEADAPPPPPGERENVRFFLAYKMKERLGLTEAQTLKVLDILKEGDEFRIAHRQKMQERRGAAYRLLNDPKTSDADFKKMADEMTRLKDEAQAKMDETERKMLALLTPKQQLEWILFKRELQRGGGPDGERPHHSGEGRGRQGR